ncbi:MAG: hypothetical protein DRR19_22790 [Candidatus Parabeggiatoa sp. nov. 1]|nr:MAG: hypothetical protein DRR19_22790 [Gammaproteobacteria bacterium]
MPKTILILAANPKETTELSLKQEVKELEKELHRWQCHKQFVLKPQWATTLAEVRDALLNHQPQIVHFSGHGTEQPGIVLENEAGQNQLISTDALANFFAPYTDKIDCVILSAGVSAVQTSAIIKYIKNVISVNQPVTDKAAIQFACRFYEALAAGKSIETAFHQSYTSIQVHLPAHLAHLKPLLKKRYTNAYCMVPIPPNPTFSCREKILQQLQETLHFHQTAVLSGNDGVGKTQTAAHYAHLHRHEYQAVLWTSADTVESLKNGLVAIAHTLGLTPPLSQSTDLCPPLSQSADLHFPLSQSAALSQNADSHPPLSQRGTRGDFTQIQIIVAVKRWLENHSDWLLILDNVDDISAVSLFLRKDLGVPLSGDAKVHHLLLTTRAETTEPFAQRVEIKEMLPKEGIEFLWCCIDKHEAGDMTKEDERLAGEIVEALGGLPLALAQAGAYIRETQCRLADYLEHYRTYAPKLLKIRRIPAAQDYPELVTKTWLLAFEKIANENRAATELLRLCAFLHPVQIPEEIFISPPLSPSDRQSGRRDLFGEVLAPVAADPMALDIALSVILKYSLLQRNPKTKMLSIHRIVQLILKRDMAEKTQRIWAKQAVRIIANAFSSSGYFSNGLHLERLLPCVQTGADLIKEWQLEFEDAARLLNQLGYYFSYKAEYAQAKPLYERALTIRERVLDKKHHLVATNLNNLAELYYVQSAYEQAKPLYERVLAIYKSRYREEHPHLAGSLNNLALLHYAEGAYEQAKPLSERAVAIYEKVYGKEHAHLATSLNNLALLYSTQGAYEQALPLYKRALAIREKVLGKEHITVAQSLSNLAALYYAQGAYAQAKPLYDQALAIRENALGKEHPDVATGLNDIAKLYYAQSANEQAQPLYDRAVAIYERAYGKEHPLVAKSLKTLSNLYNLAKLYDTEGAIEQAKPLYQQVLATYERVHGKEHPAVAPCLLSLAVCYDNQGEYEQAKPLYERALKIFNHVFNPEHPDVRAVSENYARLLSTTD